MADLNSAKILDCFDGFIFDFDGVLADTEALHFKAWNMGFEPFGGQLTLEEYLPLKSTGRKNITAAFSEKMQRTFSDGELLDICKEKDIQFEKLCENADESLIINGARELLSELKSKNKKVAVASSASTSAQLIKKLGLSQYFDKVVDGNFGLPKKPDPAVFLKAAELLKVKSEKCLVFEDSIAGIKAAQNAGMSFVAVGGIQSESAIANIRDLSGIY